MFSEGFQIAETAVFVNKGVLIKLLTFCFSNNAGSWNKFYINLAPLSGILHLFIRFGLLFGVGQLHRSAIDPAQGTVQAGDGSGIATHS